MTDTRLLTRASIGDTARVARDVLLPMLAQGVILRRPRMLGLAERIDAEGRAGRRLAALRSRYGERPLLLRIPRRDVAVVLDADDADRLLRDTPEPFAAATREKTAALRHFQPHAVLASTGTERAERRRFNEAVLETGRPVHSHGESMTAAITSEAGRLAVGPALTWPAFERQWWRIVRRIVLGDSARDDSTTTDLLRRLRAGANWAYLRPRRNRVRARFEARLQDYVRRAEPGSLAAVVARTPAAPGTDPAGQLPHWLFAFDAAGIAVWRALALLSTRPDDQRLVGKDDSPELPYTRACVLESVRLWPTTLAVLRESTAVTRWDDREAPAGTEFVIASSAFHRDPALPYADSFTPRLWTDGGGDAEPSLFPFSGGPARCPGRDVVLHTTSTLLHHLISLYDVSPVDATRLRPGRPLPKTLDHTKLRVALT